MSHRLSPPIRSHRPHLRKPGAAAAGAGCIIPAILSATLFVCGPSPAQGERAAINQEFRSYWLSGTAEISRYELKQARYGELHKGNAVLIFVTEEFLPGLHVKYEHGTHPDRVPVLKLNSTRKFLTGIYPYSVMTSVFTPLAEPGAALKVSFSAQEWCGHVYAQWNRTKAGYSLTSHSYFQDEADQQKEIDAALMEDNLWVQVRINPTAVPVGQHRLIPGSQFLRLRHQDSRPQAANISRRAGGRSDFLRVAYPGLKRTIELEYERSFPHAILGWKETHESGWGARARTLTTEARRTHVVRSAYWNQNRDADRVLRKKLGL